MIDAGANVTDNKPNYQVYYEGGTVDRWWVAPAGLSLDEASRRRVGRLYHSEYGARMKAQRLEYRLRGGQP